jgi:hypothetical protein
VELTNKENNLIVSTPAKASLRASLHLDLVGMMASTASTEADDEEAGPVASPSGRKLRPSQVSRLRADSMSSVVDPDLVGSEIFSRIRIRKNHSGSEQLRRQNEFEVKLLWKTGKI